MNIEMVPIQIIALKFDLEAAIRVLRQVGCVHIDTLVEVREISATPLSLDQQTLNKQEELGYLLARIKGLLDTLGRVETESTYPITEGYLTDARCGIETLLPQVQSLTSQREMLQSEFDSLPRYEATLRKLLPFTPASARDPANVTVGLLVDRIHMAVLDSVGKRILDMTSGRAEVVASDVDSSTRAMMIVFPGEYIGQIESLLGQEDVTRLRLPSELGEGPPDVVLEILHRRMASIPEEITRINNELSTLAGQWCNKLYAWRDAVSDELESTSILPRLGETEMTFVLVGWVPARDSDAVRSAILGSLRDTCVVQRLTMTPELMKRAPVVLQNPRPAQPFESLVTLLALPRYGHIDPTRLMAFFLPIFFGMILGDIGYGALLLAICLIVMRKLHKGVFRDVLVVLAMGSGWSIIFGMLYGEAFGTLGEHFGLHAVWFDRVNAENIAGLLGMTIAVGAVHLTLGLVLGIWEAIKDRSRSHLLERAGMLVGLISIFFLTGVLTNYLPRGLITPAIAGLILGIVLLGMPLGWLGVIMGPIEFIGLIGNLLSYLRIAAIGLASIYLAKVANDVAGMAGSLIVGTIIAVLIHALNLVLGAFSPTIHSLRLHYVEFFRKFFEGGGRPYQPFKQQLVPVKRVG